MINAVAFAHGRCTVDVYSRGLSCAQGTKREDARLSVVSWHPLCVMSDWEGCGACGLRLPNQCWCVRLLNDNLANLNCTVAHHVLNDVNTLLWSRNLCTADSEELTRRDCSDSTACLDAFNTCWNFL